MKRKKSPQRIKLAKSKTRILDDLKKLAETLDLTSVQVILLFCANEGWLNLDSTTRAITILEKVADDKGIQLKQEIPYFAQLIQWRVIPPELGEIFGFTKPKTGKGETTESPDTGIATH